MNTRKSLTIVVLLIFPWLHGQNYGAFKEAVFPTHLIDSVIIVNRGLEQEIEMLSKNCNWRGRDGNKIDVFWLKTADGSLFGHVYEYFMDCDNLRLIYWQADPQGFGEILDFMIEPLEEESQFVIVKKKHLKNKEKYRHYFSKN